MLWSKAEGFRSTRENIKTTNFAEKEEAADTFDLLLLCSWPYDY